MANIQIRTGNTTNNYTLVDDGFWKLEGQFSKWTNSEVTELKLVLTNKKELYEIEDVHYCKNNNRLEIHVFKGNNLVSKFTADASNLKQMTLGSKESRNLDFIDYYQDEVLYIKRCFKNRVEELPVSQT